MYPFQTGILREVEIGSRAARYERQEHVGGGALFELRYQTQQRRYLRSQRAEERLLAYAFWDTRE